MPELTPEQIAAITKSVSDGFDEQIAYTQKLVQFGGQRGHEDAVQEFIFEQFANRGYSPVKLNIDEEKLSEHVGAGKFDEHHSRIPVVVGECLPKSEKPLGKSLILNGHIDIVPVGPLDMWTRDPYSGHIEGDRLYGRGSGDMRAGAAANLWALDALRRIGLRPGSKVILQSVVEEESTGNGTLMAHLQGYQADAALIPEPEDEKLVRANVGVLWFKIEVRGTPVHVNAMGTGVNAIDACFRVVTALRELEADWNQRGVGKLYFEEQKHPLNLNVAKINGGDWASSVPAWCSIECRVAIFPGVSARSAADEIEAKVATFSQTDAFLSKNTPKISWNGFFSEGYVLDPGSEAEKILGKSHQQATGEEMQTHTTLAYLDGRVFSLYDKIPALVYGPVSANYHGFDEWVSIKSVKRITTAIALFIAQWCGVEEY
ncbi:acetylornithine deacetylase [Aaosphaeria arxii CBS 175.79]|uniref:Acetylornithine deacetylase n=1 Tax=Aaosphaeria arxii CBS 175.79 TaxID=1450172 RepID=A0A6A5XHQ0_9PLEO|nr:acetylornithine deacetylase [Aaosphaeria arxii CBS 175.79]KAF2011834.1 acetylornithine deacetylase [Aaosphaeria arxii CBS 175.79]